MIDALVAVLDTAPNPGDFSAGVEAGITVGAAAIVALIGVSAIRKLFGL